MGVEGAKGTFICTDCILFIKINRKRELELETPPNIERRCTTR